MKVDKYISKKQNAKYSQAQIKARLKNRQNSHAIDNMKSEKDKKNEFDNHPKIKIHDYFQQQFEDENL